MSNLASLMLAFRQVRGTSKSTCSKTNHQCTILLRMGNLLQISAPDVDGEINKHSNIHSKSAGLQHLVADFAFQHGCPTLMKGGEWQAAIFLLACMSAALVPMTAVTVAAAISACEKCVQWTMALQIFAEAATSMQLDVVSHLGSSFRKLRR